MHFQDLFSDFASDYKAFRPTYPESLFQYLASVSPSNQSAWDCATGNGQAALALKPFFRRVVATDASKEQIAQAERADGIEYLVAPAEQTQIAAGSIDLVAVAQALHWFDLPRFFSEVRRVARLNGILACWCYSLMTINRPIDVLIRQLYDEILKGYWSPERALVDQGYQTIEFPFEELKAPEFQMNHQWDFRQIIGYLNTWSAVQTYKRKNGSSPILLIHEELRNAWEIPGEKREVVFPLHLRVGRVVPR